MGAGPLWRRGPSPSPKSKMRRAWALVDMLTSVKRRANQSPPTAELIRRKFETLPMPALDTLSILVHIRSFLITPPHEPTPSGGPPEGCAYSFVPYHSHGGTSSSSFNCILSGSFAGHKRRRGGVGRKRSMRGSYGEDKCV